MSFTTSRREILNHSDINPDHKQSNRISPKQKQHQARSSVLPSIFINFPHSSKMRYFTVLPVLALGLITNVLAAPTPDVATQAAASVDLSVVAPAVSGDGGNSTDALAPLVKRAIGASGTAHLTWKSARSFTVSYSLSDTSNDNHPVYIEMETYDTANRSKYVLRCNNNYGSGSTITCSARTYTHTQTLVAAAAHVCVNVQLGSDKCSTSPSSRNPYA